MNYYEKHKYLRKFGRTLLNNQIKDGKYKGMFYNFIGKERDIKNQTKYIPSQVCLGLLKLYKIFKDERYLNSVKICLLNLEKVWNESLKKMVIWHIKKYHHHG